MKTVLIVDDDRKLAAALALRLEAAQYRTLVAHDGLQGLHLAVGDSPPDLLILDVWLPGYLGPLVAQRLQTFYPGIPVIIISASRGPQIERIVGDTDASAFFEKPFDGS